MSVDYAEFSKLISEAASPADVVELIEIVIDSIENGSFEWDNDNLRSFLRGMALAVSVFDKEQLGEFQGVLDSGIWRTLSEILGMSLVLD